MAVKKKNTNEHDKEFLESFMNQVIMAKQKGKRKTDGKQRIETRIGTGQELKESVMSPADIKKKIKEFSIEKEKIEPVEIELEEEKDIVPKPTPSAMINAPEFKNKFGELPEPPKVTAAWPLPPTPKKVLEELEKKKEIPKPMMPKPIFASIDLGKLNSMIKDQETSLIQCDGAGIPIKIKKQGKIVDTIVSLSEDEIKNLIRKFVDRAGMTLTEPVFKASIGNLTITAVTSSFSGSRFVISKS